MTLLSTRESTNVATSHLVALAIGMFSCNLGAGPFERTRTLPKSAVPKMNVTFDTFSTENFLYTLSHVLHGWIFPPL